MILGLHYDIRLCICKYLYREHVLRHIGIVQYIFVFYNRRQFGCPFSELCKFHLSCSNHVNQPQRFLGFLLTRSSKQMLGS